MSYFYICFFGKLVNSLDPTLLSILQFKSHIRQQTANSQNENFWLLTKLLMRAHLVLMTDLLFYAFNIMFFLVNSFARSLDPTLLDILHARWGMSETPPGEWTWMATKRTLVMESRTGGSPINGRQPRSHISCAHVTRSKLRSVLRLLLNRCHLWLQLSVNSWCVNIDFNWLVSAETLKAESEKILFIVSVSQFSSGPET